MGGSGRTAVDILNASTVCVRMITFTCSELYSGKETRYPLDKGLGGTQIRPGRFGKGSACTSATTRNFICKVIVRSL
jgi:hypothetical protein